ncbi:DUF1573 domain-containing protein [Lacinutrix sp.]|uniref:DUF1573 domain-containing protein n=1 Tax=Lacinutrix sp. TaxID=1937692 RepID=UPI0025B94AB6|nr:DUF1573 domain-containing protein [Lacinutrix sp.]
MNKFKILILILIISSCNSNNGVSNIEIDNQNIELGLLKIGDTINKSIFINSIGKNEFKIDSIGVSCGCTLVKYDKSPIPKDQSAEIKIRFIPNEKGKFNKSIVVEGNSDPPFNVFYLKGEVK